MALRNLLGSVDYVQLESSRHQSAYSHHVSSRIIDITTRACHIALPAIIEVDASRDQGNIGFDDEFDEEVDDEREIENLEVAYAFRVVKEAVQVLDALLFSVPFPESSDEEVADVL